MEIIHAEYTIVTPMFLGGANQEPSDGIRPPSVKGALRFWWRALNWGKTRIHHDNDEEALQDLHEQEALLFGSTAYDNKQRKEAGKPPIGKSRFNLRVKTKALRKGKPVIEKKEEAGLIYLLGQGLYDYKQKVLRTALTHGTFSVECLLHPSVTPQQRETLEQALLALGTLGGLGSRARKGFGSVAIQKINSTKYPAPKSKAELANVLKHFKQNVAQPPFTAFSAQTRMDLSLVGQKNKPLDLLNIAGDELQLYRSYGRDDGQGVHRVGAKKAEQNFEQSHDVMYAVSHGERPNEIPHKAVFGLPQNYFFSSTSKNVEFSLGETGQSRRASPLLLHIHQFPDKSTLLVQSVLPALFLQEGATLLFKVGNVKKTMSYRDGMTNWQFIYDYMDRFQQRETV